MPQSNKPYTKRMYDAESEERIYGDIPETLYKNFKHALIDPKIKQKKAMSNAIQLWLDNQDNLKSNCMVCGKTLEFTGFLIYNKHTFESAVNNLKHNMLCDNPECTIEFEKTHDIDNFNELVKQYGDDKLDFCDAIQKSWDADEQ